jgi:ABC-2 type transport system permease protein
MTAGLIANRARALRDLYLTNAKNAVLREFQYRLQHLVRLLGFLIEPIVYLVVWTAVVEAGGGTVGGYTTGTLAAYYLVWTLVRSVNMVFTPYGFEWRIRNGYFSGQLARPAHPIHYDLSSFAGGKAVQIMMWLPIAAVLAIIFRPSLSPTVAEVITFCAALGGAYLLRSLLLWLIGLVTFWTTRVAALFEVYVLLELLLSGRLAPLSFMPDWAQSVAGLLPFKWTFAFPIEALVGDLTWRELLQGVAMQAAWIAGCGVVLSLVWKLAVRRYTAVGN